MGVWSTGLYASDFALDLRSTISAVFRLPFDAEQLVDVLCEIEPAAANDSTNEDYSVFWLVVADQFAKRSIVSERARETALHIIDQGIDLAMQQQLGMTAPDLAKRRNVLEDVRVRITTAQPATKPRSVLKRPQPFLMDVGEVICYPTSGGKPINPYIPPHKVRPSGPLSWAPDGWSAFVVIDRGRAFDFLTWYRPLTVMRATPERPLLADLYGDIVWVYRLAGTCSPVHFKRMRLEKIGSMPIDHDKLRGAFELKSGARQAIGGISMSNRLSVGPSLQRYALAAPEPVQQQVGGRNATIVGIQQVLKPYCRD
jgi:hypothetical protein